MAKVDSHIVGFCDVVRLAWTVLLMLTQDKDASADAILRSSSENLSKIYACLELMSSNNVFHFLLTEILQSAAYQVR